MSNKLSADPVSKAAIEAGMWNREEVKSSEEKVFDVPARMVRSIPLGHGHDFIRRAGSSVMQAMTIHVLSLFGEQA